MLIAMLTLVHMANAHEPQRSANPRAERVVTASVTIIAAEEIRFAEKKDQSKPTKGVIRQHSQRGGLNLIEFY
jgi:hypothetical protein